MKPLCTPKLVESFFARAVVALLAVSVKMLYRTLRVSVSDETRDILKKTDSSALFAWHDSISMLPYINVRLRRRNPMTGLISSSRDGAYLAYFFSFFGVKSERGSSSNGGARSAVNLIRLLRAGGNLCITPDGPRGPNHTIKDGMFSICQKCPDSRMVFLKVKYYNSWKLKSWDSFNIPKPFSRVEISATEFSGVDSFVRRAENLNVSREILSSTLLG